MKKNLRLVGLWPYFLCLLLTSCSLKTPDGMVKLRVQPNRTWGDFFHSFGIPFGQRTPAAVTGMDCYFATITGEEIELAPLPKASNMTSADGSCPALGATSPLVTYEKLSKEGAPISVRKGTNRLIQIFGVVSRTSNGCTGKAEIADFVGSSFRPNIYEVGRTTADLTISPSTIYIETNYSPATATDLVETCTGVPSMSLTATNSTIAVTNTTALTASGGVPPYSYAVVSGSGSAGPSTPLFTPSVVGTAVVAATDSTGFKAETTITVVPTLSLSASPSTIAVGNTSALTPTGGVGPFSYSIIAGSGTMTGAAFSPSSAVTATIQVTDSLNNTATTNITVNPQLGINPSTLALMVTNNQTFSAVGGVPPFVFSLDSGSVGSIDPNSGAYSAGSTAGTATVRITDSLNSSATASVTVAPQLAISPATYVMAKNESVTFSSTGGVAPVTYSKITGPGGLGGAGGNVYTPGGLGSGSAQIRATDLFGNSVDAAITLVPQLTISSSSTEIAPPQSVTISTSDGIPPVTLSLVSGPSGLNTSTGVYTPSGAGTATIEAKDSRNSTAQIQIIVRAPLQISPATDTFSANETITYSTTGGVGSITYTKLSGPGTLVGNVYTPGGVGSGSAQIEAKDLNNNTSVSNLTLVPQVSVSSTAPEIAPPEQVTISSSNGVPPVTISLLSGPSGFDTSTNKYTPTAAGLAIFEAKDHHNTTAQVQVTVRAPLQISPATDTFSANETITYSSTGGVGSITFSKLSGPGTLVGNVYTPGGVGSGSAQIEAKDSNENTSVSNLTLVPQVSISTTASEIAPPENVTISSADGVPPVTLSLVSGPSGFNSGTGKYAPSSAGLATFEAKDKHNTTAQVQVTVRDALQIIPASETIAENESLSYSTTGGVGSITYSLLTGPGSLSGNVYSPATVGSGSAQIEAKDLNGNKATSNVSIQPKLQLTASKTHIVTGQMVSLATFGGVGGISLNLESGPSGLDTSAKTYTPASDGTAKIRAKDTRNNISDVVITVEKALAISPKTESVVVGDTVNFSAIGGVLPLTYVLDSGPTGLSGTAYTPQSDGSATIKVTDNAGNSDTASVTVYKTLTLSPGTKTIAVGESLSFTIEGGVPTVTLSKTSGPTTLSGTTYTPDAVGAGSASFEAKDAKNHTATSTIQIEPKLQIIPSAKTIAKNETLTLSSSGGVGTKTFSHHSGIGGVAAGKFSPGGQTGTAQVKVKDDNENFDIGNITVVPELAITASKLTIAAGEATTLSHTNGVGSVSYSVKSGPTGISGTTYQPSVSAVSGIAVIEGQDVNGNTATVNIQVNDALTISPSSPTTAVGRSIQFTTTGGVGTRAITLHNGTGTGSLTGDTLTAVTTGDLVVRVTDDNGNQKDANVHVNGALTLSPASPAMVPNSQMTFQALGGVPPYSYSQYSGNGSMDPNSGVYKAQSTPLGSATVRVTDSDLVHTDQSVTIGFPLTISPSPHAMAVNTTREFTSSGGVAPIALSLVGGGVGSLDTATGIYTAPTTGGTTLTIRATDSQLQSANTADSTVTITNALTLTPTTKTMVKSTSFAFTAADGVPPYTYSAVGGSNSLNTYTAPGSIGVASFKVSDSQLPTANTATSTINVVEPVTISPSAPSVALGDVVYFTAGGGTPPYTYSISSGTGVVDSTGVFHRTWEKGSSVIQVSDADGFTSSATATLLAGAFQLGASANQDFPAYKEFRFDSSGNMLIYGATTGVVTGTNFSQYGTHGYKDVILASVGSSGYRRWVSQIGRPSAFLEPYDLKVIETSGISYITGKVPFGTMGGNQFGAPGSYDVFIAKFDSTGVRTWVTQIGTGVGGATSAELGRSLALQSDGSALVCGNTTGLHSDFTHINTPGNSSAFFTMIPATLASVGDTGAVSRGVLVGALNSDAYTKGLGCALTSDQSHFYLAGTTTGHLISTVGSHGLTDIFVAKFATNDGGEQWIRQRGPDVNKDSYPIGMERGPGDDLFVFGSTTGEFENGTPHGYKDAFVMVYTPAGVPKWTKQIAGGPSTNTTIVSNGFLAKPGGVFVYGNTDGSISGRATERVNGDVWVAKLHPVTGALAWTYQKGASAYETTAGSFLVDASGNVYLYGTTNGNLGLTQINPSRGHKDVFVIKLDSSGTFAWGFQLGKSGFTTQTYGVAGNPENVDFLMDGSGNVYAYGITDGNLSGSVIGPSGQDRFILKIDPTGTTASVTQFGGSSIASFTSGVLALNAFVPGFLFALGDTSAAFSSPPNHLTGSAGNLNSFLFKFKASDMSQQ